MSKLFRLIIWVLFLVFLFTTAFYTGILTSLSNEITLLNTNVFQYIPNEFKFLAGFLIFILMYIFIENKK